MKIDRNKFETYFIDYLDGNLTLDEIDMLLDFLNENPDLKEELKGLEHIKIEQSKEGTPAFNHLKKNDFDHPEIFEEICIRAIENDLEPQELKLFKQHLSWNPEHEKEFELFQATISEPDPFIVFENKLQLKKKAALTLTYFWYAAAVILLGLFLFFPKQKIQIGMPNIQVAQETNPVVTDKPDVKNENITIKPAVKAKPNVQKVHIEKKEPVVEEKRIAELIEPLSPVMTNVNPVVSDNSAMALVPIINPLSIKPKSYSKYLTLQEYFASQVDEVNNKGLFGKIVLNTLIKISGEKFNYTTTGSGKVETLEYNSKLLAFTIPLDN
jgi:hypothetical protein